MKPANTHQIYTLNNKQHKHKQTQIIATRHGTAGTATKIQHKKQTQQHYTKQYTKQYNLKHQSMQKQTHEQTNQNKHKVDQHNKHKPSIDNKNKHISQQHVTHTNKYVEFKPTEQHKPHKRNMFQNKAKHIQIKPLQPFTNT